MTRVVATLSARTVDGMRAQAERAGDVDLVECRLDALASVDADALRALAEAFPGRAVATYRPEREGGAYAGPESAREVVLNAALAHGFAGVDVEHDAAFAERVLAKARDAGALGILSRHDFDGTPPAEDLVKFAEEAAARGAAVAKFATRVNGPADADALVTAATACRARGLPIALMGVNDAFLRLLAPTLGLALAYAAPGEGEGAAPGQLPAARVRATHDALTPALPRAQPRPILLFGDPVAHSRSHVFQNAAFRAAGVPATYVPARVATRALGQAVQALRALDALGANVTLPHKVAVLQHVDALDDTARHAGAANTLVQRDGHVTAFNTDGTGALDALTEAGVRVDGARVLVLGAGGAARAIVPALTDAGATVTVTNRSRGTGHALAERAGAAFVPWDERDTAVMEADVLVNATRLGLDDADAAPVDARRLRRDLAVFDAVYRPGGTALVRAARRAGCRAVVPGEAMLLHQGARAFTLWTTRPAPVAAMRAALAEVMRG